MKLLNNVLWLPLSNTVELSFSNPSVPDNLICSVFGFILNNNQQLLMIKKDKGWDIPGGGTEPGETPEQTLEREIREEAMIDIVKPELIATNKLTIFTETKPEQYWRSFPISYELFYCCRASTSHAFIPNVETEDRSFFYIADAMDQEGIQFGNRKIILESIINRPNFY